MEKYQVLDVPEIDGKKLVKRSSDGLIARCKMSWLIPYGETGFYVAKNNTKAIRLDGLEWKTEE